MKFHIFVLLVIIVLFGNLITATAQVDSVIGQITSSNAESFAGGPFEVHGFQPVTAPPSRFRSFPAWLPTLSLDKAYVRGAIQVQKAHVVKSRATRDASDHLPLVLDFDLGESSSRR